MKSVYEQPSVEMYLLDAEPITGEELPEQSGGAVSNPFNT